MLEKKSLILHHLLGFSSHSSHSQAFNSSTPTNAHSIPLHSTAHRQLPKHSYFPQLTITFQAIHTTHSIPSTSIAFLPHTAYHQLPKYSYLPTAYHQLPSHPYSPQHIITSQDVHTSHSIPPPSKVFIPSHSIPTRLHSISPQLTEPAPPSHSQPPQRVLQTSQQSSCKEI